VAATHRHTSYFKRRCHSIPYIDTSRWFRPTVEKLLNFIDLLWNRKIRKLVLLTFDMWQRHIGTRAILKRRCHSIPYINTCRWFRPMMGKLLNFKVFLWVRKIGKLILHTFCLWQWHIDTIVIFKRSCHWILILTLLAGFQLRWEIYWISMFTYE